MATFAPARLIQGAARRPFPYGLFSVLNLTTPIEPHWQAGGVQWEMVAPEYGIDSVGHPAGAQGDDPNPADPLPGEPSMGTPKNFDMESDLIASALPFSVYGHWKVSPMAYNPEQAQMRALEHLVAFEEMQVEKELWEGTAGNVPNLTTPAPTALGSSAGIEAVALLEEHIVSTYGSLGVIHMSRGNALRLIGDEALEVRGNMLQTRIGTPVVAGSGYPKTHLRATPALFGFRSEVFYSGSAVSPLLDTRNNDLYAIAERTYIIGYDSTGVGSVTLTTD